MWVEVNNCLNKENKVFCSLLIINIQLPNQVLHCNYTYCFTTTYYSLAKTNKKEALCLGVHRNQKMKIMTKENKCKNFYSYSSITYKVSWISVCFIIQLRSENNSNWSEKIYFELIGHRKQSILNEYRCNFSYFFRFIYCWCWNEVCYNIDITSINTLFILSFLHIFSRNLCWII